MPRGLRALLLGLLGFGRGEDQPEAAITAIRWLTSIGPIVFLSLSIAFARGYPLTRAAHGRILDALDARDAAR